MAGVCHVSAMKEQQLHCTAAEHLSQIRQCNGQERQAQSCRLLETLQKLPVCENCIEIMIHHISEADLSDAASSGGA